jgi:hypothetical protein
LKAQLPAQLHAQLAAGLKSSGCEVEKEQPPSKKGYTSNPANSHIEAPHYAAMRQRYKTFEQISRTRPHESMKKYSKKPRRSSHFCIPASRQLTAAYFSRAAGAEKSTSE